MECGSGVYSLYLTSPPRLQATRSMLPAAYFCSGTFTPAEFRHYGKIIFIVFSHHPLILPSLSGLASEIYTHFTSPIRRYADVLVHRLISACIGAEATYPALVDKDKIANVCERMNHRHRMAQYASRASLELHSCMFFQVGEGGEAVVGLSDNFFPPLRTTWCSGRPTWWRCGAMPSMCWCRTTAWRAPSTLTGRPAAPPGPVCSTMARRCG